MTTTTNKTIGMVTRRVDVILFSDIFGVTLNGKAARVDVTKRGMIEVRSPNDRAVFVPRVAELVCARHHGNFVTREARV